jgi:hypothetical protein
MKKMNLPILGGAMRKLMAEFYGHKGARNSVNNLVHATATEDQDGFQSAFDKLMVDQRCRRATGLQADKTYDILKDLGIGYWIGRKFKNAPKEADGSMSLVEITGWEDYLQYNFTRLTDGRTWTRTIYTDTYDTGWNDNIWVKVVTTNGFTGHCAVRKVIDPSHDAIEVRFSLKGTLKAGDPIDIATLPNGYTTLDPNAIYFNGTGAVADGSVPVGFYIHGGNKLGAYRLEKGGETISELRGFAHIERGDSTILGG